jgi:SAM-dependent methyltransferase
MSNWVVAFILLAGGLFALKMAYALSVALVLPATRGALYVSTSRKRIGAFLDAVPMQAGQVLVDLGCGDGRVLRCARRRYSVMAIGYELNLMAYTIARLLGWGMKGVEIKLRNFWKADLSKADIIFCYLFPDVLQDLCVKLKKELKPGAVVVSCNFALPQWPPDTVLRPGQSLHNDPIYVYKLIAENSLKNAWCEDGGCTN